MGYRGSRDPWSESGNVRMSKSGGVVVVSENVRAIDLEVVSTWPSLEEHLGSMTRVYSRARMGVVNCRSTGDYCLLAAHSMIGMVHRLGLQREDDSFAQEERVGGVDHLRDHSVGATFCRRDRLVDPFFVAAVGRSCRLIHCRSRDRVDVLRPCCFRCCCLRDRPYVDVCVVFRAPCRTLCQSVCRQPCQSLLFRVPLKPDSVRATDSQLYTQSSGVDIRPCGGEWK